MGKRQEWAIHGPMANYNFTPNFSFHTGLGYVNYGYNIDNANVKVKAAERRRNSNSIQTSHARSWGYADSCTLTCRCKSLCFSWRKHYAITYKHFLLPQRQNHLPHYNRIQRGILAGLGADWKIDKVGIIDIGFELNKVLANLIIW